MGLLDKLFKKQPDPVEKTQPEKIEIKMDSLADWLKKSNSQKISSVLSELTEIWQELNYQISQLKLHVKELDKAVFEKGDKTYAVVNMTKELFARKYQILNKIPQKLGQTLGEINSAYSKTIQAMAGLNESNQKQAYVVSTYFKKESESIIKTMKIMDQLLSDFNKSLNSEGSILFVLDEVDKKISVYRGLEKNLTEIEKELLEKTVEIKHYRALLDSQKTEMQKILSDQAWSKLEASRKNLEQLNSEIEKTKSVIVEDFSSIKRPVKKLLHEAKLTKEQKTVLSQDLSLENPAEVYPIFKQIDKVFSESKIGLKESEQEKLNYVRAKIESGELENTVKILQLSLDNKKSLEEEYRSLYNIETRKAQTENEIKLVEEAIEKSKSKETDLESQKKAILNDLVSQKASMQALLIDKLNKEIAVLG